MSKALFTLVRRLGFEAGHGEPYTQMAEVGRSLNSKTGRSTV